MDNYIPEGLQEFTGYKNEFLKKIQKATAPYREATMAVQKAMKPYYQATMAVQKAIEPYYKATAAVQKAMKPYYQATMAVQKAIEPYYKVTAAVQKAMKPIYETNERIQKILTPTYTVQELIKQASKPYASPIHNSANLLTQAFIGGLPPVIKTPRFPSVAQSYEVQELVQTVNSLASDDSILPSDTINDINNADIHIDTVDISEELAHNISSVLKDKDIFVESASSKKPKTVYIDVFKKYLIIFIVYWLPAIMFAYEVGHDYLSDKSSTEFQYKMLEEEHNQTVEERKQTKLLQDIDDKLSQSNSVISKEKY